MGNDDTLDQKVAKEMKISGWTQNGIENQILMFDIGWLVLKGRYQIDFQVSKANTQKRMQTTDVGTLKGDLLQRSAGCMSLVWETLNLSGTETSRENAKLTVDHTGLEFGKGVQSGDISLGIS